jgi:hypothetical protein
MRGTKWLLEIQLEKSQIALADASSFMTVLA